MSYGPWSNLPKRWALRLDRFGLRGVCGSNFLRLCQLCLAVRLRGNLEVSLPGINLHSIARRLTNPSAHLQHIQALVERQRHFHLHRYHCDNGAGAGPVLLRLRIFRLWSNRQSPTQHNKLRSQMTCWILWALGTVVAVLFRCKAAVFKDRKRFAG